MTSQSDVHKNSTETLSLYLSTEHRFITMAKDKCYITCRSIKQVGQTYIQQFFTFMLKVTQVGGGRVNAVHTIMKVVFTIKIVQLYST